MEVQETWFIIALLIMHLSEYMNSCKLIYGRSYETSAAVRMHGVCLKNFRSNYYSTIHRDAAIVWTKPPPVHTPSSRSDTRTTNIQLVNGSVEERLIWDFTLTGETLDKIFWEIEIDVDSVERIGIKRPSGSTSISDVKFLERFNISSSDPATLIIYDVTEADEALFSCTVENELGQTWKDQIQVEIVVESKLTSFNGSQQTVCEGDDITLLCDATGKPDPNITWTRVWENGSDSEVRYTGNMFALNNINRSAEGTYRCTAYNGVGKSVNHTVNITVNVASSIEPVDANQPVTEGVSKTFYCNASGKPPPLVSWTKVIGGGQVGIGHMLNFTRINRTDAGEYKCEASNECGNASAVTSIIVEYAPSILNITANKSVNENDAANLTCTADGIPGPNITWTRVSDNSPVSFNFTITGKQDEGDYRCTADNGVGTPASKDVCITVENYHPFGTQLHTSLQNDIVELNVMFNVTCSAEAMPSANHRFYMGGESVFNDTSGAGVFPTHVSNRVEKVKYGCIPNNSYGDGPEKTINVTVHYKPKGVTLTTNATVNSTCGDLWVTFNCTSSDANPPVDNYLLYEDNAKINSRRDGIWTTNVNKTGNRSFHCEANHTLGNERSINNFNLTVNSAPSIDPIDITEPVTEGDNVTLFCNASGSPDPTVNWTHVTSGGMKVGKSWNIRNVSRTDAGEYKCQAANECGNDIRSVNVNVNFKPDNVALITNISDHKVCLDDVVNFTCTAEASPPVHSYLLLYENQTDASESNLGTWHKILSSEGQFNYRCVTNNSVGTGESTNVTLTVDVSSSIEDLLVLVASSFEPVDNKTVKEGDNVTLFCNASGSPDPTVNWTHVTSVNSSRIKGGETWNITNINRADAGEYKCEAANECGNDMESVNVNVQFRPNITDPPTGPLGVRVGEPIDIECTADGNPPPRITWTNATSGTAVDSGGTLSFDTVEESDNGFNYTCTAENGIGPAASSNITLVVGDNITTIIIQLLESYHSEYKNVSSNESKQIILKIQNSLRLIPEINNTAVAIIVTKLSEGSVIAKVMLKFKEIVHIGSMISAIRAAAENGSIGNLEVNATSVRIFQEPKSTSSPTTTPTTTSTTAPKTTPKEGTSDFPWWILGVAVGGLILLAILIAIVAWCIHKKRKCRRKDTRVHSENEAQPLEEFSNGTPNGENAEDAYAQVNHGYAKSGPAPTNENNQGAASASAVPPVTYAVVDKSKKNEKPPEYAVVDKSKKKKKNSASEETPPGDQYAAVDKSKKKKKKSGANEEKPPEDQYAVVLKSQKKKNPEEPEQQYAQVDRSMKKKHAKPGEVLYADLGEFHGNNSLPKVSTSPEPLPPIKKPTAYVETQYADITQFLKGDATLPSSDGTGGVTSAAQGQPTAGAQVGTGGAAATPPGEEAGGGSSHVSKL